jgi:hypothetical protein
MKYVFFRILVRTLYGPVKDRRYGTPLKAPYLKRKVPD